MTFMSQGKRHAKIVIIGTEGAGKTIFISCFAKYFEGIGKNGRVLEPMTKATSLYVDENWRILQREEWPPATNAGQFLNLHWQLRIARGSGSPDEVYSLLVVDSAGHDLRCFFADEKIANVEELPLTLKPLAAHCRDSDIVLLLVSLNAFMADTVLAQTTDNQWAIKYSLDYKLASKPSSKCALIFTQSDIHQPLLTQFGNWGAVAAKYLPHVHGAYLKNGKVPVFAVSAVNMTQPVMLPGGATHLMPAGCFGHDGFDGLMTWITNQAKTVAEVHQTDEIDKEINTLRSKISDQDQRISDINQTIRAKELAVQTTSHKKAILPTAIVSALIFLLLMSVCRTAVPFPPIAANYHVIEGPWGENDDVEIQNNNDYSWSNVRVWFGKATKDVGPLTTGQIPAGGSCTWPKAYNFHQEQKDYQFWVDCDESTGIHKITEINWGTLLFLQLIASGVLYTVFFKRLNKPDTMWEIREIATLEMSRKSLGQQLQNLNAQPRPHFNQ